MTDRNFQEHLDAILEHQPTPLLPLDDDQRQRLAVARELTRINLAVDSLVLTGLGLALAQGTPRSAPSRPRQPRRAGFLTSAAVLVVLIAALGVLSPDTLAAITKPVVGIVRQVFVGPQTTLDQTSGVSHQDAMNVLLDQQQRLESGIEWYLETPYAGLGGAVPEGAEPYARTYSALGPLAHDSDLTLLVPTVWPEHLPEIMRFNKGWLTPTGSVILLFCRGPWQFALSHFRVGPDTSISTSRMLADDSSIGTAAPEVQTFVWDGVNVTWWPMSDSRHQGRRFARERESGAPPFGALYWENDGVSYSLDGDNLTLERAEEIWRSLEVYRP